MKYILTDISAPLLLLAVLYTIFEKSPGERYAAFVILTVNANDSVRQLHRRMPLIIPSDADNAWLGDETYSRSLLLSPCKTALISREA